MKPSLVKTYVDDSFKILEGFQADLKRVRCARAIRIIPHSGLTVSKVHFEHCRFVSKLARALM